MSIGSHQPFEQWGKFHSQNTPHRRPASSTGSSTTATIVITDGQSTTARRQSTAKTTPTRPTLVEHHHPHRGAGTFHGQRRGLKTGHGHSCPWQQLRVSQGS